MKLIWTVVIAVIMVLSSSVIAFDHSNPNNSLFPTLQIASLSNNPNSNVSLWAGGGLYNDSGTNIGWLSISLSQVQNTFEYNNEPYIASSLTPDGLSSTFSLLASGNLEFYGSTDTGSITSGTIYIVFTTTITIQGNSNPVNTSVVEQLFPWSDSSLPNGNVVIPYQYMIVPTQSITGSYNSIVNFAVNVQILSTPEYGWGFFEAGNFHTYNYNLQRQVLILPATSSLGKPTPNPVKEGQTVSIPYTTGYAPITGSASAYTIEIIGSSLYNGGSVLQTYSVGQNIQNGIINYITPSNSFVPSASLQANQFEVIIFDNWFPLIAQTFFTIDNYSYEPPTPTITILHPPSNSNFIMGNFYTIQINYSVNQITLEPIHYIDLWIFSAATSSAPAQFIVNDLPITADSQGNGSIVYTFQLSFNSNSLWIQAQSVDYQGRASQQAQLSISSYNIHSPNITLPSNYYVSIIIAIVIATVGSILIFLTPLEYLSRGILIFAWVISVLIILNSYLPGVL
jgi:hypothetical protein